MTFRRPPPKPAKQIEYQPRPREAAVAVAGPARAHVAVPKPEPVKPGKRAPTKAETQWMNAITEIGCIACYIDGHPGTSGAVHHLLRGGLRIGHMHTICLCQPGHHMDGQSFGKISRHPNKAKFEDRYGTEAELLHMSRQLVATKGAQ